MIQPATVSRADVPPKPGLTWFRGPYRLAYHTFWSPWHERSGPIVGHIGLSIVLNTLVAAAISLGVAAFDSLPVGMIFREVFPFAQCIGITIVVLQGVGHLFVPHGVLDRIGRPARGIYWGLLCAVGGYVGYLLASFLRVGAIRNSWNPAANISLAASMGLGLIICIVIYQLVATSSRAAEALEDANRERVRTLAAEAMAVEANLKLLQAQIEPHFLFNTLANVLGLIEARPADARAMLEDLIRYLRATLAMTRRETTTLGAEAEMMQAYLSIFRFRMGQRLSFSIDIASDLRDLPIAPMLLQPIVENALKHGLEPKIAGGSVVLRARRESALARVYIEVADSGLGFEGGADAGFGLSNVRERLRALYGEAGRLEIRDNPGGGTLVTLAIPEMAAV